jgi:DNA repair protein RadC
MEDMRLVSESELIYNVSAKADMHFEEGDRLSDFLETLTPSRRKIAKSAIELYKRERARKQVVKVVRDSMALYELMCGAMAELPNEEFWVVYLNQGARVIGRERISVGGISGTVVDVRCVLRGALMKRAVCIAVCHNHPSGQARPSMEDDALTRRLFIAAKTMDIRLIDHVIVTDGNYYSYADEGRMSF